MSTIRNKTMNVMVILVFLLSMLPTTITNAQAPTGTPIPPATSTFPTYLLTLPLPSVQLPPQARAADVPGYYQMALQTQWDEVEGVLSALKEDGRVESYGVITK